MSFEAHSHQATPLQPILPITVTVKKIKGAAHQWYSDNEGVVRCEQTFRAHLHSVNAVMSLVIRYH